MYLLDAFRLGFPSIFEIMVKHATEPDIPSLRFILARATGTLRIFRLFALPVSPRDFFSSSWKTLDVILGAWYMVGFMSPDGHPLIDLFLASSIRTDTPNSFLRALFPPKSDAEVLHVLFPLTMSLCEYSD